MEFNEPKKVKEMEIRTNESRTYGMVCPVMQTLHINLLMCIAK